MGDKFSNKKPIELTEEETFELVKQIAEIEYSRNANARVYQDAEDGAVEFLTYSLEKDARGKKGLNSYYRHLDMSHFKNLVHFEIRNHLNYNFRKTKVQKLILEPASLDSHAYSNNDNLTLGDIQEDNRSMEEIEEDLELDGILNKIDDTEHKDIYIKIKHGTEEEVHPFNYRNLTQLYYEMCSNKTVTVKDFKELLYDKNTNKALEDNIIKKVLLEYKQYMKHNNILGGAIA